MNAVNDIGEGAANLVGAGPQGGPLGGFKPYAQTVDDIAAVAAAPFTGGASLAIPGAFAAEDLAKGNYLGAAGNAAAVVGGAYNAGVGPFAAPAQAGGASAGGAAGTAAAAAPPGDVGTSFSIPTGTDPMSAVNYGADYGAVTQGSPVASGSAPVSNILGGTNQNSGNVSNLLTNVVGTNNPVPNVSPTLSSSGPEYTGPIGPVQPSGISGLLGVGGSSTPGVSGGGSPGGGGSADAGFFGNLSQGNYGKALGDIPLGAAVGGAGIGYEALRGTPSIPNLNNLTTAAGAAEAQSQTLIGAEQSGQLPPGAAAGVKQGLDSAVASIRGQFASQGLSGSSMEADAIAQAQEAASSQSFQIASTMAQQGISLAGLPASIYGEIMNATLQNDNDFSNAIVNFATSAAGGGQTIRIGGTNAA